MGDGQVVEGGDVAGLRPRVAGIDVVCRSGSPQRQDAVVIATGAVFGEFAARFGLRRPVQAGRGCCFSVLVEQVPGGPLDFPQQRVACTPLNGRLRVAGIWEFRRPDDPLDPRRTAATVDAVWPKLSGVDLDDGCDEWVGSRPYTPDGLPLIGRGCRPACVRRRRARQWGRSPAA